MTRWGQRYLMCPPDHFKVEYAINPWMTPDDPADVALAAKQWSELVEAIESSGGTVETIDGGFDLPDMVFTANLGVVVNDTFIPSVMRHPERQAEPSLASAWASGRGLTVAPLPQGSGHFEGMGDALPFGDRLVAGHGSRSDVTAWEAMASVLGRDITAIELPDPRFYHIDLVFSPLDDRTALIAPIGLTALGLETLSAIVPEPIILTDDEAMQFSANSITVGDTVIMPACSDRLRRTLEELGKHVVVVNVSEFLKAGGAVRCLTLPLDA